MVDYIHASDGAGLALTATIATDRPVGFHELIVDSVSHWPSHGIAEAGTLDFDTLKMSDKTVFRFHLDGSIITIEEFAPGYSDIGNVQNQVVVIKPSTEWANAVADRVYEIEVGAQWYNGAGAPNDANGNDGDYYLNDTTGDVYTKVAGTWGSPIVNIEGPTGATGAPGAVWRTGTGAPSNSLGINGDYYINTTTSDVYFKASGTYSIVVNIKGATGATGPTGPAGSNGLITSIQAGANVTVDNTIPSSPKISTSAVAPRTVTVSTAATTATKVGSTTGGSYVPASGDFLIVTFSNGYNIASATLNIDSSGAKAIWLGNTPVDTTMISTTTSITVLVWYDGTHYQITGIITSPNSTMVWNETPSGTINGTNPTFTLANAPAGGNVMLTLNGDWLKPGSGNDYTISGNTITFLTGAIPPSGSNILATYALTNSLMILGSNSITWNETPTGTINGTTTLFTCAKGYIGGSLKVYINGILQINGTHFTETSPSGGTFTMSDAPATGDNIIVTYQWSVAGTFNADTVDAIHANTSPTPNYLMPLDANGKFSTALITAPYKVRARRTTDQSMTDATFTTISFDTKDFDTGSNMSATTFTTPVTGYYQINFVTQITSNTSKGVAFTARMLKNGSVFWNAVNQPYPAVTTYTAANFAYADLIYLTAGDTLQFQGYCDTVDSSSPVITAGSGTSTIFSIALQGVI